MKTTSEIAQLALTSISTGVPNSDLLGLGVELETDEGVRLTKAIAVAMRMKNRFYKADDAGNSLFIKTAALRKSNDVVTFDRFDIKLRIKNGNSDIFVLATLSKRKTIEVEGTAKKVKPTWYLNVTVNPTHLITKSRNLCLLTYKEQRLSYKALIRSQIVGFIELFDALPNYGIDWQPSDDTRTRIQAGDVYFQTLQVSGRSPPLKAKVALQAERILQNVLMATDVGRNPKKGAVRNTQRSVADYLGLTVKPLVGKKLAAGENAVKGVSIGVQSNKGNRSLDATLEIKLVPHKVSGGRSFVMESRLTREYFEGVPAIAELLKKEARRLMLRDVLSLSCGVDGKLELLGNNQATQQTFFEALAMIRKELVEERLRLNTLVWVEEGAWQAPLKAMVDDPDFSSVLRFWRDGKRLNKEERDAIGSQATYYRRLQEIKKGGLDLTMPHWLYLLREEAVSASFYSERHRTWLALNRGAKLPAGMHRAAERGRKKFFASSKNMVESLHRLWDETDPLPTFDMALSKSKPPSQA